MEPLEGSHSFSLIVSTCPDYRNVNVNNDDKGWSVFEVDNWSFELW